MSLLEIIMFRRFALCGAVLLGIAASVGAQTPWSVGTWAAAPVEGAAGSYGKRDLTVREIVHVSIGAEDSVSVVLSNEFGREPLTIGAATIARRTRADAVETPVAVMFHGQKSVTIAPGERVRGEAKLTFPAGSDVAVSLFVPQQPLTRATVHNMSLTTNYFADGDQTMAASLTGAKEMTPWAFLAELGTPTFTAQSIVCLGDSITDGARSTKDTNGRWPDHLAERLRADKKLSGKFSVLNEGISGNRVLRERTGPAALARFDRDVLNLNDAAGTEGRRYLIVLEGINDIGHAFDPGTPHDGYSPTRDAVTAAELIAADRLMIARAHAHGMKILFATLTPYGGAKYEGPGGDKVRMAVNDWIRTSREHDGVVDFDKAVRDAGHPERWDARYDSGDHLHPNDAGLKAMAAAVDLSLFR